jgi:hypothetical protein
MNITYVLKFLNNMHPCWKESCVWQYKFLPWDNNKITLHHDTPFLTKIMHFPNCQQPFDLVSIVNNVASNNNLLQFIFFVYFNTLSPCHLKLCLKNISNNTIHKLKLKILKTKFFNLEIFKEIQDDKFISRGWWTWLTYLHLQSIKLKSTQFLHPFGII